MRLIIALVLPWMTFFTINRPVAGILCLLLQVTLVGWLPAALWAAYALSEYDTGQKIRRAVVRVASAHLRSRDCAADDPELRRLN